MTNFQIPLLGWMVVMSQFFVITQGNTGNTYYWTILGLILPYDVPVINVRYGY